MLKVMQALAVLMIFFVSTVMATQQEQQTQIEDWPQAQMMFVDLVMQTQWISERSARASINGALSDIGLGAAGVSCSSTNGEQDCFCAQGQYCKRGYDWCSCH